MIPKIIHYCWFGNKEKPADVISFIDSWKKHLPDYKIVEWNETNFPYSKWRYAKEAYDCRKYAFVSDVCRLYALLTQGGIYLDTDVEVLKSFEPFLNNKSFIGLESPDTVSSAVIGAEKNCNWIRTALEEYDSEKFILNDATFNITPNVQRLSAIIKSIPENTSPTVYPIDYFCANDWKSHSVVVTQNTVCIHHFAGTWTKNTYDKSNYKLRLKLLYKKLSNILRLNNK